MSKWYIYFCILVVAAIPSTNAGDCADTYNSYYWSTGDVYITGFFNAHRGLNCSSTVPNGLQQMTNLATIIEMLNNVHYIPGITIGTILYDLCAVKESANKALISSIFDKDCKPSFNLGVLTTKEIYQELRNLSAVLNIPIFELLPSGDINLVFKICIHLLIELHSTTIDLLLMPTAQLSNRFVERATEEGICVKQSVMSWPFSSLCLDDKSVIVLAGTMSELQLIIPKINPNCTSRFIIALIDSDIDFGSFLGEMYFSDVYIIVASNAWIDPIVPSLEEDDPESLKIREDNISNMNISLDFMQMAATALTILDSFNKHASECYNSTSPPLACQISSQSENTTQISALNRQKISSIGNILRLEERNVFSYVILKSVVRNKLALFAEIKLTNRDWMLEFIFGIDKNLDEQPVLCDFSSTNFNPLCKNCSNNKLLFSGIMTGDSSFSLDQFVLTWKTDIWVPAMVTVIVIGIVCCICVLIFIIIRIWKNDMLEGNPCTSILLALGVICMYATVLPFCVTLKIPVPHYESLHCACKLFGTGLSYTVVFSVILSRSVMILTCDYDGSFMSHINGYLHSFLCFFMVIVQVGLVVQFGTLNWFLLKDDYCVHLLEGNLFLLNQSYNGLLLGCLVFVTPSILRSKRNYKEGVCFALASICILITWLIWCGLFVFSRTQWKDFSVAFGLCVTASIIVICVFIPRSYLLMNGVIRDQITNALPSLNCAQPDNILDMKYRSNQALYDSVDIDASPKGRLNSGYYYNDQNSNASAADKPSNSNTARNFNYLRPPDVGSISKVTRF